MWSGLSQTIALTIAVILFFVVDFAFIVRYESLRPNRSWDWGYTLLAWAVMGMISLQPVLLPGLGLHLYTWPGASLFIGGILLVTSSLGLQIWARLHLQQFYAEGADIQPNHRLVDTGPYMIVRHPLFDSYFLFALGLFCIAPAITTLGVGLYTFWDFRRAASADEQLLSIKVPGYKEYMMRTPRFFPKLRVRKM